MNKIDKLFDTVKDQISQTLIKNYVLEAAVNNGLNYVYVVDVKTNTIIYSNHVLNDLFHGELKGKVCHENIKDYFHGCDLCAERNKIDDPKSWTFWSEQFDKMFFVTRVFKIYGERVYRIEKATDITSGLNFIRNCDYGRRKDTN